MTENQEPETNETHHPSSPANNSVVLRFPKPNLQVVALGLIALVTLFQSFQLVRISAQASATPTKTVPASTSATNNGSTGAGSNADVPQSQVGGC